MIEGFYRHRFIHWFLRTFASPFICMLLNFKGQIIDHKDPYIVVSNHNTDWDSIMLGIASRRQIYFIASEHVLRLGFFSRFIQWAQAPIARLKGRTETRTAMDTIKRIRAGANVGIFGEGNRSFNGRTGHIHHATGKLVKACNCRLITYKLIGGYLTTPRWAKTRRRGRLRGVIVGDYTKEQVSSMTPDEIMQILERDLQEDAYERQSQDPVRFVGKDLAESIETSLYICPVCSAVDSLVSKGDRFCCRECGTKDRFDEYGFFSGAFGFRTVTEWDNWQDSRVKSLAEEFHTGRTVHDEDITLYAIHPTHVHEQVARGTFTLYDDRLTVDGTTINLAGIREIGLVQSDRLLFGADNTQYEIRAERAWCARKYLALIVALNNLPYTH